VFFKICFDVATILIANETSCNDSSVSTVAKSQKGKSDDFYCNYSRMSVIMITKYVH